MVCLLKHALNVKLQKGNTNVKYRSVENEGQLPNEGSSRQFSCPDSEKVQ